jgi:hypothetical protein
MDCECGLGMIRQLPIDRHSQYIVVDVQMLEKKGLSPMNVNFGSVVNAICKSLPAPSWSFRIIISAS